MTDIRGDLAVVVVEGINLQNLSVFGACNPYVLVKLRSSLDSVTTSVKDGEDNPTWQDTFTFRGVSSTDELQISLMEKEGEREGVVSVASYIPSTMWGFPGTGGSERELKVVMPSTTGRKANRPDMGTVVLRLQYQAELPFRSRFNFVKAAASKTGEFTKKAKIDVAVDKILSLALKPANMATGMAGRMTKKEKLISGGAVAVVGTGASMGLMALAMPLGCLALLFLPLTVMGGFFLAMMAMMIMPAMMVIGWVLLCSRPVQCRIWMPALFWAVATIPNVKKVLIKSPTPGTEQ